jgi:hypothetical protein
VEHSLHRRHLATLLLGCCHARSSTCSRCAVQPHPSAMRAALPASLHANSMASRASSAGVGAAAAPAAAAVAAPLPQIPPAISEACRLTDEERWQLRELYLPEHSKGLVSCTPQRYLK